jgi:solute carrier family 25 carnitine/acylcarnitine transporter 20/29
MEAQHKEYEEFVHHEGQEPLTFERVAKDLLAGSVAGVANVISGHPLDTFKIRMQMLKIGFFKCIRSMYIEEGMFAFYKGVAFPLYSVPLINSIVFAGYESAKWAMGLRREQELSMTQGLIAGAWAGFVNCLIVTPVELVKINQQMEGIGVKTQQTPAMRVAKTMVSTHGYKILYKANNITILREVFGWSAQFAAYEEMRAFLNRGSTSSSMINDFIAGGFSGLVGWIFQYPQDIIKTKLQMDLTGIMYRTKYKDGGFMACAREIMATEGIRGFWVGFSACSVRAVIANAFTFLAYEQAKSFLL